MAFYIVDTPYAGDNKKYLPAHNELMFVVSATTNTDIDFKYTYVIQDVQHNRTLSTVRQFPDPNGYGVFDAHRVVESYIRSEIEVDDTNSVGCNDGSSLQWRILFGTDSQAFDVDGNEYIQHLTAATSDTYYLWNATLPHLDYMSFDSADYVADNDQVHHLTTEERFRIHRDAGAWIHYLQDTTKHASKAIIKTYNTSNSLIGSYIVGNSNGTTGNTNRVLRFPSGPRNIALIPSGIITVASGSLPIITSSVDHYTIHFEKNTGVTGYKWSWAALVDGSGTLSFNITGVTIGIYTADPPAGTYYASWTELMTNVNTALVSAGQTALSWSSGSNLVTGTLSQGYGDFHAMGIFLGFPFNELIPMEEIGTPAQLTKDTTYYLIDEGCRYPVHNLVFRNPLGGFDSIQLVNAPHRSSTIKQDSYQKVQGSVTDGQWGYTAKGRGLSVFNSLSTKKVKGSTMILTDSEYTWVEQLLESPECYEEMLVNGTMALVPVIILTAAFEEKYGNADGPTQFTCEYRYAHKQNSIR